MNRPQRIPVLPAGVLRTLLWGAVLIFPSCGRTGDPLGARGPDTPPTEVVRPRGSDDSGWFPVSGPERLAEYEDRFLPSGAGFRDLRTAGPGLLILDNAGGLYTVPANNGDLGLFVLPAQETALSAMAAGTAGIYLADDSGTIRSFVPTQDFGRNGGAWGEAWSAAPGFRPDWLMDADGSLICASGEGGIAVLAAGDGAVQAFRDLGFPFSGKPVVAGDVLAIPRANGIVALRIPSLEFLWSGTRIPADSAPLRAVGTILAFQDRTGPVYVVDARTGTELYSLPADTDSSVACDGDRWYVAGSDGRLGAFRLSDGVPVWTAGAAGEAPEAMAPRVRTRLAVDDSRLYLASAVGLESWSSGTGERIDQVRMDGEMDGLYLTPGRLYVRFRGGTLRIYGGGTETGSYPDLDSRVRPSLDVVERISLRLEAYAEPGAPVDAAWRTYISGAVPSLDYRFTIFRYESREAGTRIFSQRSDSADRILVAVFDADGEERHSNVGELGVDASFEYWLEAGTWYVAAGRLRGSEPAGPVFLEIR